MKPRGLAFACTLQRFLEGLWGAAELRLGSGISRSDGSRCSLRTQILRNRAAVPPPSVAVCHGGPLSGYAPPAVGYSTRSRLPSNLAPTIGRESAGGRCFRMFLGRSDCICNGEKGFCGFAAEGVGGTGESSTPGHESYA